MQKVSKAYKESMTSPLRERAYIMLSFGLVNQEVQSKATISKGDYAYYSRNNNLLTERSENIIYATLEENFTRLDGSMMFLPRPDSAYFYDTGLVSNKLVSNAQCEVEIKFNTTAIDVKGLTVKFGVNYPVDFDIVTDTGQTLEFRNNNLSTWSTEEVLTNATSIRLIFYRMKNANSRLRIYSIRFGYGLIFDNEYVMDSTLDTYVSPIGAGVPQIDFSVQLKNYDHYFNVDNPTSAINYLETGQEMDIMYGYQLPDSETIEWIQGNHLFCSEWESDDNIAVIRCQDVFRNMDGEYYKGRRYQYGRNYYDLAREVLVDAGISDYYIDPRLKTLFTYNPLPRVKHKEALQIIANACRCTLTQSRFGQIQIKSNFIPEATATANGETAFSNVENILDGSEKIEYGMYTQDYTALNRAMYFVPRNGRELNTGYISKEVSDNNGLFAVNPVVTIRMEALRAYYGIRLVFGSTLPKAFTIRTFNQSALVNEFLVDEDEISKETVIIRDFDDCDRMQIIFTETAVPNNRIVLNNFSLHETANFTMSRGDMISSPKAIKQELIKDIIVPCYIYQTNDKEDNLVYEDVDVTNGEIETYYIQDPSYGFTVLLNETLGLAEIIDSGNYFITIRYKTSGSFKMEVRGHRYKIVEKLATRTLNNRGKTVRWENPLVSDMNTALDLAEWLGDYYTSGIEYEYDTRGNPELDATDIVYQENEFYENMKVIIYRHSIQFRQGFAGKVTARRTGG